MDKTMFDQRYALYLGEIARECGFCDQSYFSKVFTAKNKITPTDFRSLR